MGQKLFEVEFPWYSPSISSRLTTGVSCIESLMRGTTDFKVFGKSSHHPTASLPQHGFARTSVWRITAEGTNSVTFSLNDTDLAPDVKKLWDHEFSMDYTVELGETELKTTLQVRNPGTETWECNNLLHTYLRVPVLYSVVLLF